MSPQMKKPVPKSWFKKHLDHLIGLCLKFLKKISQHLQQINFKLIYFNTIKIDCFGYSVVVDHYMLINPLFHLIWICFVRVISWFYWKIGAHFYGLTPHRHPKCEPNRQLELPTLLLPKNKVHFIDSWCSHSHFTLKLLQMLQFTPQSYVI